MTCRKVPASHRRNRVPEARKLLRRLTLPLRRVALSVALCGVLCAAVLVLSACGVSVKPSGQVVTSVGVGR